MSHRKLILASLIIVAACAPAFGDWTYNPSTGHWYRLTAPGLTWAQAEDAAVKLGGHLVTVNDAAEQLWLYQNFPNAVSPMWIGLYQLAGSSEPAVGWVWVSGDPATYRNWGSGEPNDGNAGCTPGCEQYAETNHACGERGCGAPGFWNDIVGNGPQNGIIERDIDPAVPTVSEWGLVVMTLLTLAAGTIILVRPRLAF